MGTSRASNAALQRQIPQEGLTAQAVEPGGEGSQAALLPAGEDLQTPIRLWGAGSTLPLLPALPSLLVSSLCQPALLAGKLEGKTLPMQSDGCRQYLVLLGEAEQTLRLLRIG